MMQNIGVVSQEARVSAVNAAWSNLALENAQIYQGVMKWGKDSLTSILEEASGSINPLVSATSLEKNARDRLKATIASKAHEGAIDGKPADELLFGLVLKSMREDMRLDSQSARKERK